MREGLPYRSKYDILYRLKALVGRERWQLHRFTDGDRMLCCRHQVGSEKMTSTSLKECYRGIMVRRGTGGISSKRNGLVGGGGVTRDLISLQGAKPPCRS